MYFKTVHGLKDWINVPSCLGATRKDTSKSQQVIEDVFKTRQNLLFDVDTLSCLHIPGRHKVSD